MIRQIRQLRTAGITDLVINLYHLGDQIEAALGDGSGLGVAVIRYSRESELLETGGGMVKALPMLGEEPFTLLNGDILTDFQFSSLPQQLDTNILAHLLLDPKPPSRERDFSFEDGRIVSRGGDWVYCGIGLIRPHLFLDAPTGPFSLRDLFSRRSEIEPTGRANSQRSLD